MRQDDKWARLAEDPDIDEESQEARQAAAELHSQANALSHGALHGSPDGDQGSAARLQQAISMYRQAIALLAKVAGKSATEADRGIMLQCCLNSACLALRLGDEPSVEQSCAQALELDSRNPHAALFRARLSTARREAKDAATWLRRARAWAKSREDHATSDNGPRPQEHLKKDIAWLSKLLQQGVALFKQRQLMDAKLVLEQVVGLLDDGGPVERLSSCKERVLAFDALEALAEVLGAQSKWHEALGCGRRAALLLEPGSGEAPFPAKHLLHRKGLLLLSLGHLCVANGDDPVPDWRCAANALREHADDPATEGHVLLELGLCLAERAFPTASDDSEAVEDAAHILSTAFDRLSRALDMLGSSGGGSGAARRTEVLARKALDARATLASLHVSAHDKDRSKVALDESAHLLRLAPQDPTSQSALDWAGACRKWAMAAMSAECWHEAESALQTQLRLGEAGASTEVRLDAFQALAALRRRQHDEKGVDKFLRSIEELALASGQPDLMETVRASLRRVAPIAPQGQGSGLEPALVGIKSGEDAAQDCRASDSKAPEPCSSRPTDATALEPRDSQPMDAGAAGKVQVGNANRSAAAEQHASPKLSGRSVLPCSGLVGAVLVGMLAVIIAATAGKLGT